MYAHLFTTYFANSLIYIQIQEMDRRRTTHNARDSTLFGHRDFYLNPNKFLGIYIYIYIQQYMPHSINAIYHRIEFITKMIMLLLIS